MSRSTKSLSLILVGSVVALGGCYSHNDDEDRDKNNGGGGGRVGYVPRVVMGGGGGRSSVTPSVSSRGGFGGSAHAGVGG